MMGKNTNIVSWAYSLASQRAYNAAEVTFQWGGLNEICLVCSGARAQRFVNIVGRTYRLIGYHSSVPPLTSNCSSIEMLLLCLDCRMFALGFDETNVLIVFL